jgi:hypothetical protein
MNIPLMYLVAIILTSFTCEYLSSFMYLVKKFNVISTKKNSSISVSPVIQPTSSLGSAPLAKVLFSGNPKAAK